MVEPIDRTGTWPTACPAVAIRLAGRPSDCLNWNEACETGERVKAAAKKIFWQIDLGLEVGGFTLEDEFAYRSLQLTLQTFTKDVWPKFEKETTGLSFFCGKRVFDDEFCNYCQMLSAYLPDDLPVTLLVDGFFGPVKKSEILSCFEHFQICFRDGEGLIWNEAKIERAASQSPIAVCMPDEPDEWLDKRLAALPFAFKVIPERFLNERWSEVDYMYVFSKMLSPRGKRMLQGFCAAGGVVVVEGELIGLGNEIGAEGFEPPAYWSQTSRASQTALCPVE